MTSPSDTAPAAGCLNGCLRAGVHYATCKSYDADPIECAGCAPELLDSGTLICDRCYRRLRFLLHSASDILGRMRSLAEHGKAVVYSAASGGSSAVAAPDQVDPDLLEATVVLSSKLRSWRGWIGAGRAVLDQALSDHDVAVALLADVLELHPGGPEAASAWSLADAHARWGVERRDRFVYPSEEEPAGRIVVSPVREWYDPLLPAHEVAKRAGISEQQLRVWVQREVITPVAKLRQPPEVSTRSGRPRAGRVVAWFKTSEVEAALERMQIQRTKGRFKPARVADETP